MPQIDLSAWRENVVSGCTIGGKHTAVGESAFPSPCTSCICSNDGVSVPQHEVNETFPNPHYSFQPQCASLRITDCAQLAREWPREVILRDDVCSAQCGLVLQSQSSRDIVDLRPPPPRVPRSRPASSFTFQGFKFPDLTQFVG